MAQGTRGSVTKSVTAQNQFSDAFEPHLDNRNSGVFNISISGTWVATVTIQRRFSAEGSWFDVDTHTANIETFATEIEQDVQYRIGCKTGEFTSGTAVLRLSQ